MRTLVRYLEGFNSGCGAVAAALVFVLMTLMAYEVVMRYLFDAPTIWSYDLSTMTMGAIFALSIGYTLTTDSHVRVDVLRRLLGDRAKPLIDLLGYTFVILPLLICLDWGLWDYFYGAYLSQERAGTSAWNPRVWPFRAVLFVGALAWTLQVVAEIIKAALDLSGRPLVEPGRSVPLE